MMSNPSHQKQYINELKKLENYNYSKYIFGISYICN